MFDKGSAVVIIFNDTTDAEAEEDNDGPSDVEIVGHNQTGANALEIYVYGGSTLTNKEIGAYLEKQGYTDVSSDGAKWTYADKDAFTTYKEVVVTVSQVWKVAMASTWQDAASNGTDKTLITAATIDGATIKVGNTVYVKASDTVDLKVTVGTLTTNTTLTIQVANSSATLAASTKALDKDTAGDHDATITVTTGALSAITKDIELNVKVTDT